MMAARGCSTASAGDRCFWLHSQPHSAATTPARGNLCTGHRTQAQQRKESGSTAGNDPRSYLPSGASGSRAHRPRVMEGGGERLHVCVPRGVVHPCRCSTRRERACAPRSGRSRQRAHCMSRVGYRQTYRTHQLTGRRLYRYVWGDGKRVHRRGLVSRGSESTVREE